MSKEKHDQCSDSFTAEKNVIECIQDGHPVMVILRGVTGSGKSTYALKLAELQENFVIHSFDEELENTPLTAEIEEKYLPKIIKNVKKSLSDNISLIIIDTENTNFLHLKSFAEQATRFCYEIYVMEPDVDWKYSAQKCALKGNRKETVESISTKLNLLMSNKSPTLKCLIGNGVNRIISFSNPLSIKLNLEQNENNMSSQPSSPSLTPSRSSPQSSFISLAPLPQTIQVRDMGTNCNFVELVHSLANDETTVGVEVGEIKEKPKRNIKVIKFDRSNQFCLNDWLPLNASTFETEFASLVALFGSASISDILHFYTLYGFKTVFSMFSESHYFISPDAFPLADTDGIIENIAETFSSTSRPYRKKQQIKYITELKLSEKKYVPGKAEFPVLECYPNSGMNHYEAEEALNVSSTSPSSSNNDIKIQNIMKTFKGILDKKTIEEFVKGFDNLDEAEKILADATGYDINNSPSSSKMYSNISKKKPENTVQQSPTVVKAQRVPSAEECKRTLTIAQKEAEEHREKYFNPLTQQYIRKRGAGESTEHVSQRIRKERLHIDNLIIKGNINPLFIDLHQMSADGAINFFINHISRKDIIGKKIQVVTGAGNRSAGGVGLIRTRIKSYLDREKIPYEFLNRGIFSLRVPQQ